jgi:hypothetical protein
MDEASAAFTARIFPATGITAGSSALPKDQLFKRMTRSEFVNYIRDTTVRPALEHAALHVKDLMQGYQAAAVQAAAASSLPSLDAACFGTFYAVVVHLAAPAAHFCNCS